MVKELKCAIVGAAGGQGNTWLRRLRLWKKLDEYKFKITAVADINEALVNKRASDLKCNAYTDYNQMFEKEELDLAIVATPHYVHAPISISAAEHNVNVLCEKIMCINLQQADEMKEAVEKNKIKFAVGFQHRYNPIFVAMRNALNAGDLGELFQINMIYHWWRTEDYYLNSTPVPENKEADWEGWRGHWLTEGGGAIANQIVHFIDAFVSMSPAPIKSLYARSKVSKHTFVETDDNTNAIVEFQNDAMGLLQAGVAYQHDRIEELSLFGLEGMLGARKKDNGLFSFLRIFEDKRKREIRRKRRMFSLVPKRIDMNKAMLKNLLEAIRTDDPSIISVDVNEGRKTVEILRAILLSQVYDMKIDFPFNDDPTAYPELAHPYTAPEFA